MDSSVVAVAGATGALGHLISEDLRRRGVQVKALVRPGTDEARTESLRSIGVTIVSVDLSEVPALTRELAGVTCVISALQGLEDVLHIAQGNLLDAAVAAKVPRFIPSDYGLDFTKTKPGSNRNYDIRREFHTRLNDSGITWTSILNGAFLELIEGPNSSINRTKRRVIYIGSPSQELDFTTMADTAAYTAAVAVDPKPTPNFLRIAGDVVSTEDIVEILGKVEGVPFHHSKIASLGVIEWAIWFLRLFGGETQILPLWQAMQYMVNMYSGDGQLVRLDNDRYPDHKWTSVEDFLREFKLAREAKK